MVKRPDLTGLARIFDRGDHDDNHPVDTFLSDEGKVLNIAVTLLRPDPDQPRKHIDQTALDELTASVREQGIIEPIIARKDPAGTGFIIIAGERRWRAAHAAGLRKIPTCVREGSDALEIAITENLQRENLNAMEEAEALLRLKELRSFSDQQLANRVGKSRQSVNESLVLARLPAPIREECRTLGIGTKIQLLRIARAGSLDEVQAAWQAFRRGEATTTRALHEQTRAAAKRPRSYQYAYKPADRGFRLTITFPKAEAARHEIEAALRDALDSLS